MPQKQEKKKIRRYFYRALLSGIGFVWPIVSLLIGAMIGIGLLIAHLEGWRPFDGVYFAFVTGLTVGYGDLVPKLHLTRLLAIAISFTGIMLTALFAAVTVRALEIAVRETALPSSLPEKSPK